MSYLYHTLFFDPLYNLLVLLFKVLPWADAGIIVILLTIIVRLILFPLSKKAVLTQVRMGEIAPEIERIKERYKDQPEVQAKETLALYQKKGVNPFSGIFVIIIQIPLIIALYQTFFHLPAVDPEFLYSFMRVPKEVNTTFLGLLDLSGQSLILALGSALSSFFQMKVATINQATPKGNTFGDNLTKSMQSQMKYLFPIIVFFISYKISGVIALYWLTTNLFSIAQDLYVRKNLKTERA